MDSSEEAETGDQETVGDDTPRAGEDGLLNEGEEAELVESSSEYEASDVEGDESGLGFVNVTEKSNVGTEEIERNFKSIDPFDEDKADLKVLLTKPACFLIVGKPGCGRTSAARKIAGYWRCKLITPTACLEKAIEDKTALGIKAKKILQKGECVGDELVIQIMEEKLKSIEVEHYGYILDGFPCQSEEYMTYDEQMSLLQNLKMKPDVIINLRIPDMDLISRRSGLKVDPITNISYPKEKYAPEKGLSKLDSGEEAEEVEEEEAAEEDGDEEAAPVEEEDDFSPFDEDFGELDSEVVNRLVTRPEDLPENVTSVINSFKEQLLVPIEDLMADHDQQNIVEVNALLNEKTVFRQIMAKLAVTSFRPAIVPQKLHNSEEEELAEDMETEELFRTMASVNHVGPRWRWRRSKWGRFCPVALKEGNIVWGRPDLGVSFMDKMYFLSDEKAFNKFMKNPRPYLLPPQPRPPCRFSIVGPPLSGKSTLSYMLAQKYGATVFDVDKLMKVKMAEAREKALEETRVTATEEAINTVRTKLEQAQLAAEQAAREAEAAAAEAAALKEMEEEEGEGDEEDEEASPEEAAAEEAAAEEAEEEDGKEGNATGTLGEISEVAHETDSVASEEAIEVDATHPEVVEMVEQAMKAAEEKQMELPPEEYAEVLAAAIKRWKKKQKKFTPHTPIHGGYILDNFPRTRDQWNALFDAGIKIDEVMCLQDNSENGTFLLKRFYDLNKEEIKAKIADRLAEDERKRLEAEEIARKIAEEEERRRQEEEAEMARIMAEEEAARKAARGEEEEEEEAEEEETEEAAEEEEEEEKETEEDEEETPEAATTEEPTSVNPTSTVDPTTTVAPAEAEEEEEDLEDLAEAEEQIPVDAPEMEEFKVKRAEFDREWPGLSGSITASCPIEPKVVGIDEGISKADLLDKTLRAVEDPFSYKAWEYTGIDMDEEEEDFENDQDGEEEPLGEEEEEDEALKKRKRPLGDTQIYCPVELKEKGILIPGNTEVAAKYREKTYYFASAENRDKFLRTPAEYTSADEPLKPPPIRVFILGPKGSGKTLHGKALAQKLGVFHISFPDRLQEMIIAKTKKKVLKAGEDDEEIEEEPEEDEEAAVGDESKATEEAAAAEAEETKDEEEATDPADELTEEEEAIRNYLAEDEALPPEVLEQIVPEWWNREPFKSTGFVLEGFPRLQDEVSFLQTMGLYPDCAIVLTAEDAEVTDRLLPPRLERWKVRRDRRLAKKLKEQQKKQKAREEAMMKRRLELYADREARKEERKKRAGDEEEEEEEEDEDLEAQLAEEFEEEEVEEEEEDETEADAIERIKGEISERYEDESGKLQGVVEVLDEYLIPKIEINGGRKERIVKYLLNEKLKKLITCRPSIFERVYPITHALAKRMIQTGYKHPSKFGRWDPVELLEKNSCVQPQYTPTKQPSCAVYRQYVYFFTSAANRSKFMDEPRKYVTQPPPLAIMPIQLSVLGPPKSGKTTLSNRFVSEFGLVRLSIGEAIRGILNDHPNSDLTKQINAFLHTGRVVPDALAIEALQYQLLDMRCQTRGFVLDGYPVTRAQVDLLNEQHIVPQKVIELEVPDDEVLIRGAKDRLSESRVLPLHDSHKILCIRLTAWRREVAAVRDWYSDQHDNCHRVDGCMSKWWVAQQCKTIAFEAVRATQLYLHRTSQGQAASIKNLCITPGEFEGRMGAFRQYCPVSLALRGELADCATERSLHLAAEFRGKYYKMAGEIELEEFLANAQMYVPPLAPRDLPPDEDLPRRITNLDVKAMFPRRIELQGYDPVAFKDGQFRYESIVPGDADLYVAEYKQKLYCFASEENLAKFMKLPEQYWDLTLPQKLPPKKQPLSVAGLPMLGYLEQTVSTAIVKSLTAVGAFKPKHPFLSATRSSLIYVAYHLKAYNPSSSEYKRKKYRQKLEQFEEKCRLISYLSSNMTLSYRDPAHRPLDFDHKMDSFLQLRDSNPSISWIS